MKRFISWLVVIMVTFSFGVFFTVTWFDWDFNNSISSNKYDVSRSPILSFCELAESPEKYDGKIVRVSASLGTNMHGIYLLNPAKCLVNDDFRSSGAVEFANEEEWKAIDKLIKENKPEFGYYKNVHLIARAKFKYVKTHGHTDSISDGTDLHFEILELETFSIAE